MDAILDFEFYLLQAICEFEKVEDYVIFKSRTYPKYYSGNGILLKNPETRRLAAWEQIFDRHFEHDLYEHKTMSFCADSNSKQLVAEAKQAGYQIIREGYLCLDGWATEDRVSSPALIIRRVISEKQWMMLKRLNDEESRDKDWYDPDARDDPLFEMTRYIAERRDVEIYYASPLDEDKMVGTIAVAFRDGIGSVQDVTTEASSRRKGIATSMIDFVCRLAFVERKVENLYLCADLDDVAVRLYRKLGFNDVGEVTTLMTYEVRNQVL